MILNQQTLDMIRLRLDCQTVAEQAAKLPSHTLKVLREYILKGIPTGDFLHSVLCNDLSLSVRRADKQNTAALVDIVAFLFDYCPAPCCGSEEKVDDWIAAHKQLRREADRCAAP